MLSHTYKIVIFGTKIAYTDSRKEMKQMMILALLDRRLSGLQYLQSTLPPSSDDYQICWEEIKTTRHYINLMNGEPVEGPGSLFQPRKQCCVCKTTYDGYGPLQPAQRVSHAFCEVCLQKEIEKVDAYCASIKP
jgi:hypothetical protein